MVMKTVLGRPAEILLVEDNTDDVALTREANPRRFRAGTADDEPAPRQEWRGVHGVSP